MMAAEATASTALATVAETTPAALLETTMVNTEESLGHHELRPSFMFVSITTH